jgi:4,5-DOPA dioxygenase extradiol
MMALATPDIDAYVAELSRLVARWERPRAIALVSAHWYTHGKYVSESAHPETIYDFAGFPPELSRIRYGCPGVREAPEIVDDLMPEMGWKAVERGIDHGGWTVLRHLYPAADMPVFSLSLDAGEGPAAHFAIGRRLRSLRDRGIMILASGNIVHNLQRIEWVGEGSGHGSTEAREFDAAVESAVERRAYSELFEPHSLPGGRYSVPTPEHYLPMLVALGAGYDEEKPAWIFRGFEHGSISRRAVGFLPD